MALHYSLDICIHPLPMGILHFQPVFFPIEEQQLQDLQAVHPQLQLMPNG